MQTMKGMTIGGQIKPDGIDKDGMYFKQSSLNIFTANVILTSNKFQNTKAIKMSEKMNEATQVITETTTLFDNAINNMLEKEEELSKVSKKVSGNVRNAANDLSNGLLKIEKTADFNRLERYVELLERASTALSVMADLEKNGKLEKLANALK